MQNYYVFKDGKWFKNGELVPEERIKEIPTYIRKEKKKEEEMEIMETLEIEKELGGE